MKFFDEARIDVIAGDGGNGSATFRREKFIPQAAQMAETADEAGACMPWPIAISIR